MTGTARRLWSGLTVSGPSWLPGPSSPLHNPVDVEVGPVSEPATLDGGMPRVISSHRVVSVVYPGLYGARVALAGRMDAFWRGDLHPWRVARFLSGPALAPVLHARGRLPLHACAVSDGQRTVAICGDSRAGKTEVGLMLSQRGWRLIADDLTAVSLTAAGVPVVAPDAGLVAAWPATWARYRDQPTLPAVVDDGSGKGVVQVDGAAGAVPPLSAVVILALTNGTVHAEPVSGAAALRVIRHHLHLVRQLRPLGLESAQMGIVARLASTVPVWVLCHGGQADDREPVLDTFIQCVGGAL